MENATKALLIGAGVLFAVIILSFAIITYTKISGYYQSEQSNLSIEQLSAINTEYGAFDRDLTGFEIVSLINKVINFNEHNPTEDGYSEMEITVTISDDPSYNNKGGLFEGLQGSPITYKKSTNEKRNVLKQKIESMQALEQTYKAEVLTKLVSNLDNFKTDVKGRDNTPYNSNGDSDRGKTIRDVIGKEINSNNLPTKDELLKYSDYLVFKRSNYKTQGTEKNQYGQIYKFSFEQSKK